MILKELKHRTLHEIGAFLGPTEKYTAPLYSIYDNVKFYQFGVPPRECISIGFHQRRGSDEMHVLLLKTCISTIRENITKLRANERVKPLNAIVFTIDFSLGKHWYRIHPDHGNFINAALLEGNFEKVYFTINKEVHLMKHAMKNVHQHELQKS